MTNESQAYQEPKSTGTLPAGYVQLARINLMTDKKLAVLINGLAVAIMLIMAVAGYFIHPSWTDLIDGLFGNLWHLLVMIIGYIVYMAAHEWVHGIVMKYYFPDEVRYGFTGMYAYAGSTAYYNKHAYRVIALAPVVVWGIVLLVLQVWVPSSWWWVVYAIQIGNIAGAAGDFYVFWFFSRLPNSILIQDTGVEMRVFVPEPQKEALLQQFPTLQSDTDQ